VIPSRQDALGVSTLEALACGLPVVAFDRGHLSQVVHDDRSGYLVPPDDDRQLVDRLVRLAEQPELRRRLGAGALEVFGQRYDIRLHAARLGDFYEQTVAARRSRA
jgi:glycosyltransferase involved in cell wall biosynthesis